MTEPFLHQESVYWFYVLLFRDGNISDVVFSCFSDIMRHQTELSAMRALKSPVILLSCPSHDVLAHDFCPLCDGDEVFGGAWLIK